ncbi:hypothetical protein [Oceanobacillus sp. CAU 1775]
MLSFFKCKKSKSNSRDYLYKMNEEQLHRERISVNYDLIRSLAR